MKTAARLSTPEKSTVILTIETTVGECESLHHSLEMGKFDNRLESLRSTLKETIERARNDWTGERKFNEHGEIVT